MTVSLTVKSHMGNMFATIACALRNASYVIDYAPVMITSIPFNRMQFIFAGNCYSLSSISET